MLDGDETHLVRIDVIDHKVGYVVNGRRTAQAYWIVRFVRRGVLDLQLKVWFLRNDLE